MNPQDLLKNVKRYRPTPSYLCILCDTDYSWKPDKPCPKCKDRIAQLKKDLIYIEEEMIELPLPEYEEEQ